MTLALPALLRNRRLSIRAKLTISCTLLLAVAGTATVLIAAAFMRTVPAYVTLSSEGVLTTEPADAFNGVPAQGMQAGLTLRDPAAILNTSFLVSIVVLVVLIIAGGVAAWFISGRLLRPLHAINSAAQIASTGDLDHRIGLRGPQDELHDLSATFDMMLERLDDAFQSHKRFAANASHELRTPLAATETMLEVALSDPHISAVELREVAERVLETNRRNAATVGALLALAEAGSGVPLIEDVSLRSLLVEVISAVSDEADELGVTLQQDLAHDVVVRGDSVLLTQAFRNLVINGVRHNVEGGQVQITFHCGAAGHGVAIENTGAEIDAETLDTLQEPFMRGRGRVAASSHTRGHGLGLAIAVSVFKQHSARFELLPRPGGGVVALVHFSG